MAPGSQPNAALLQTISRLASEAGDPGKAAQAAFPAASRTLAYRPRDDLPMDPNVVPDDAVLLLDTTVYIDGLKRAGLPAGIQKLLADRTIRHSSICAGELAFGLGRLDPQHAGTGRNQSSIAAVLERFTADSVVDLSPSGWAKAGVLAGSLSRTQGFAQDRRRALLLDAALFVTAPEWDLTLMSGNIADMDLLLQAGGEAKVLLYQM